MRRRGSRRIRYWRNEILGWILGMVIIAVIAIVIYLKYS